MVILENLREGRLIAFDQDEDAKRQAEKYSKSFFYILSGEFQIHETISEVKWSEPG